MFAVKKIITAAALTFAAISAQAAPTLTFSTPTVTTGGAVDVDFVATDFTDLNGYGLSITFNSSLLALTSVTTGAFMATGGTADFYYTVGSTLGVIDYITDGLYESAGATGSGTLFTLHFNTLGAGTSAIGFTDLIAFDSNLADIAFTATAGSVTALPVVIDPPTGDVPEPASALLLGVGAAAFLARRRKAAAAPCAA